MAVPTDFAEIEARLLAALGSGLGINIQRGIGKSVLFSSLYGSSTFRVPPYRRKPMFTKQHYEAVATLLTGMRDHIRESGAPLESRREQMDTVNEVTVRFATMFKGDNKKFKELIFIGACDAGASTEPRKE